MLTTSAKLSETTQTLNEKLQEENEYTKFEIEKFTTHLAKSREQNMKQLGFLSGNFTEVINGVKRDVTLLKNAKSENDENLESLNIRLEDVESQPVATPGKWESDVRDLSLTYY